MTSEFEKWWRESELESLNPDFREEALEAWNAALAAAKAKMPRPSTGGDGSLDDDIANCSWNRALAEMDERLEQLKEGDA